MQTINRFKDIYKGKDIWILAAGPSMSFIDKNFFKDKITFGVNFMSCLIDTTYAICTEIPPAKKCLESGRVVLASEFHQTNPVKGRIEFDSDNFFIFKYDGEIFVGCGTVVTSMHIAAYMGAANIILCGTDCGWIDNELYFKEYTFNPPGSHVMFEDEEDLDQAYKEMFARFEKGANTMKIKVKKEYGCNVYSLNPFINFRLEGHNYDTEI